MGYNYAPQPPLYEMENEMRLIKFQFMEQYQKKLNELWYSQEKSNISCAEYEKKAQISADIKDKNEFKRMIFTIGSNGEVILKKTLFDGKIEGQLPFLILYKKIYMRIGQSDNESYVLVIKIKNDMKQEKKLIFWSDKLQKRYLTEQFEKNGLSCGFGEKKEMEIRKLLIQDCLKSAEKVVIPEKHGWRKTEHGEWEYIYPEMLTWEEVVQWN